MLADQSKSSIGPVSGSEYMARLHSPGTVCQKREKYMRDAKTARVVRVHDPRILFVIENAKYVISCLFRLYLAPITLRKGTIFEITIFYILNFHVWIYNKFISLLGLQTFKIISLL